MAFFHQNGFFPAVFWRAFLIYFSFLFLSPLTTWACASMSTCMSRVITYEGILPGFWRAISTGYLFNFSMYQSKKEKHNQASIWKGNETTDSVFLFSAFSIVWAVPFCIMRPRYTVVVGDVMVTIWFDVGDVMVTSWFDSSNESCFLANFYPTRNCLWLESPRLDSTEMKSDYYVT